MTKLMIVLSLFGGLFCNDSAWAEVRFDVRAVPQTVLPYQSCRLLVNIQAAGADEGTIDPYDDVHVFYHDDANSQADGWNVLVKHDIAASRGSITVAASAAATTVDPRKVTAAKETELSIPLSGSLFGIWGLRKTESFFRYVGSVEFKVALVRKKPQPQITYTMVTVDVVKPSSKEDVAALAAMLTFEDVRRSTVQPGVEAPRTCLGRLRSLITEYPSSSYADYWRIAAASQLLGEEVWRLTDREPGWTRRRMEHHLQAYGDSWRLVDYRHSLEDEQFQKRAEDLVRRFARARDDDERLAVVDDAVGLMLADDQDVDEAIRYLRQVDDRCALSPLAMILLRRIERFSKRPEARLTDSERQRQVIHARSFEFVRQVRAESPK
jgi:hypothetical protein